MNGHIAALDAANHLASLSRRDTFVRPTCPDLRPVRRRNAVPFHARAINALANLARQSAPTLAQA